MSELHDWEDLRAELHDGDDDALAAERARTEAWVRAFHPAEDASGRLREAGHRAGRPALDSVRAGQRRGRRENSVGWTIEAREWDDADGVALRAAQRAELDARYGTDDHEPGTPPSAADIDVFLVAHDDEGHAIGCGALRRLGADVAELKRMYVAPGSRGSGVAAAILQALEVAAAERGWTTVKLETGPAQPEAMRFYEKSGYTEIPLFGPYVGSELSVCYEKRAAVTGRRV